MLPAILAVVLTLEQMRNIYKPMLRFARQHFMMLQPFRWRLERMRDACKPVFSFEYKRIAAILDALDRAASDHLTPEELADFKAPWINPDHS